MFFKCIKINLKSVLSDDSIIIPNSSSLLVFIWYIFFLPLLSTSFVFKSSLFIIDCVQLDYVIFKTILSILALFGVFTDLYFLQLLIRYQYKQKPFFFPICIKSFFVSLFLYYCLSFVKLVFSIVLF